MRKALLWLGAVVLAAILYNVDAITGQWKFDKLCETHGGPRFFGVVEKDVGWEVEERDAYAYQAPFRFGHVAFVRYENKDGLQFDVRANGYSERGAPKYIFESVDPEKIVRYRLRTESSRMPEDVRFSRTQEQVVDLASGKVAASYTDFGYSWTKPERTILAAPTGVLCWAEGQRSTQFYQRIYNSGSKK